LPGAITAGRDGHPNPAHRKDSTRWRVFVAGALQGRQVKGASWR